MNLASIFSVFSRRPEVCGKPFHEIPETTRSRVIQWWRETIGFSLQSQQTWSMFWSEIHAKLQLRLGTRLINSQQRGTGPEEALYYVLHCPGEHFLDFMEDLFHTEVTVHGFSTRAS